MPKLSFQAAGKAMPAEGQSPTRRRFFEIAGKASAVAAATAALAKRPIAAATTAAAMNGAKPSAHPDAALLALLPRAEAVMTQFITIIGALETSRSDEDPPGMEGALNKPCDAWARLRDEIADIPARTLDGLRFKAWFSGGGLHGCPRLVSAIVDDLIALGPISEVESI
jgi:hypothetical protein